MSWKNVQYENGKFKTGGGGGASALTDLSDVNISSASDGQVLKYDSTSSKWVNANESGGGGHTYSTTEQVIGTWIDGKPLYEKVVQTTFSTPTNEGNQVYSGYIDISSEIPNIDMAWLNTGMSSYKPSASQTRDFFTGWYEQDEGKFFVLTLYSRSNAPCTLVISYTKTTD